MRLLLVTNIPSPYQLDFGRALAATAGLDPYVVFCAATERDRSFEVPQALPFPGVVLESRPDVHAPKDAHDPAGLAAALEAGLPADFAILGGSYRMPALAKTKEVLRRRGVPWAYWGEDPYKRSGGWLRRQAKALWLRGFLKDADGVFGISRRAVRHYQPLVRPPAFARPLPYASDLSPLAAPDEALVADAQALHASFGVPDPVVVLFSGSLTPRKAPDTLLGAFRRVAARCPSLCLLFAGDGPLRPALEATVRTEGGEARVRFAGFLQGRSLLAAYLAADLFVLPTRTHEGWGVVVQEALAAGCPVVAATGVQSGEDLVVEGRTGWRVPPDDEPTLAERLAWAAEHPGALREMEAPCREAARAVDASVVAPDLARFLEERLRGPARDTSATSDAAR